MAKMRIFLSVIVFCFLSAAGQTPRYPFPQKVVYPYGVMPTRLDSLTQHVRQWYDDWKKNFLQECSGNLRPGVDPLEKSLVEAQGFCMVAVAYMGDKEVFDKLFAFYQSKCGSNTCGLMNWKVTCAGIDPAGSGAATDGDIDVACALIVAHWQWPEAGYDVKAKALIKNLDKMVATCGSLSAVYPGCNSGNQVWGGCNETDISYFAPSFFRYFTELTGDQKWKKLADDTHIIRDNAANATTGLVPDWQSVEGRAGAGSRNAYFGPDAIRAPYKQTMDFLWHGNSKAGTWAKKLTSWAFEKVGVDKIVDAYDLNGTKRGSIHNMASVGSFTVAAMANTQEVLDAFVDDAMKITAGYWYSAYLGNLYLLAMSGNMWTPEIIRNQKTIISQKGITARRAVSPHLTRLPGGAFRVSGLPEGTSIALVSLAGKRCAHSVVKGGIARLAGPGIARGCYLVRYTLTDGRVSAGGYLTLEI